jgi:hypothetical protein
MLAEETDEGLAYGPPLLQHHGGCSYLRAVAKGLVSTFALLPGLRPQLPLFCSAFVRCMAAMASSMQHVAVAPEFGACPSRGECLQLCRELREAFMPLKP